MTISLRNAGERAPAGAALGMEWAPLAAVSVYGKAACATAGDAGGLF
jgi:hypothetical protein